MHNYPPGVKESDLPQGMSDEEVEEEERQEGWQAVTLRSADGGNTVKVQLSCRGCGMTLRHGEEYFITSGQSRYIEIALRPEHCDCVATLASE